MRILFVTPYVPSRIRTRPFNLIQFLSSQHEIFLVSLLCDPYEKELVHEVSPYCAAVQLCPLSKLQAYSNCLRALPTRLPLRVAYYQSPAFIRTIQQMVRTYAIDVVHGELIKVAPALQAALAEEDIPCLFDSVDCISSYLQQQHATTRHPLKKAFVYSELLKMRRYETQSLLAFKQTVISSHHDRDFLVTQEKKLEHMQTLPNGIDTAYFTPASSAREPDLLTFCAKLDYFPNVQAILYFCREVLPLIWKHRPQVRLMVVGNNPPPVVRDLAKDERIEVTGYVPDMRPYLGKASLALAPLLVAAGIQNKVLEAMAMGTPVVATPQSCKALRVQHGVHLLVADEPKTFAAAIEQLLDDPQLAQRLSLAGRQYVEQNHSWIAIADKLSSLYHDMLSGQSQRVLQEQDEPKAEVSQR